MSKTCKLFTILFNALVLVIFIIIIYFHIYYTKNTNNTLNSRCKTVYDCLGKNQMCFDNECKCEANYRWNDTSKKCQHFVCGSHEDCRLTDNQSMICKSEYYSANKSCVCNYGYVVNRKLNYCKKILSDREEEIVRLRNKILERKPDVRSCLSSEQCGRDQFCHNESCQCRPNFAFDQKLGRCVYKDCQSDSDCNAFDNKRVCRQKKCDSCQANHYIDPITKMCNSTLHMKCGNSSDCSKLGDTNQICVDNVCVCRPNHRLNGTTAQCERFTCRTDDECQSHDPFRLCRGGFCKCAVNYRPDRTDKCQFDSFNLWFLWILWWLLIMPFLLIAIVLFKRCSKQTVNGSNASLNSRTPIIYYKNNYKTYN